MSVLYWATAFVASALYGWKAVVRQRIGMWTKLLVPMVFAVLLSFEASGQDTKTILDDVARTLGATNLKSIQYSSSGFEFRLGQSLSPGAPWPRSRYDVKSDTIVINYDTVSRRREQVVTTPRGERRGVEVVSGPYAWDIPRAEDLLPVPFAAEERRLQIWVTPHGLIKAAMENNASVESQTLDGKRVKKVSFTVHGKFKVNGIINDQNLVEKVDTWIGDTGNLFDVLGDMLVETNYADYKDFNGVKFPARIVQEYGGFPILDITVTDVQPNAPADIKVPQSIRDGTARLSVRVDVQAQEIAEGVWYLTGTPWHSVAVEFDDHVVVVEAPFTEERSIAVIAEVRKIIPGKPIRYIVNTHHHFDHSGGIRTYAAEGAIIVTHEINKQFYEKVFAAPRTLNPDNLARSKKKAIIEAFSDKHVLTDGIRTIELYHIEGSPHAAGLIMAYLPKEKLLIEADVYTPGPPNVPVPSTPNPASVNLYQNIQRLDLDVKQIVPIHGRVVPMADLLEAIGQE